jgi:hypothetical protein
LRLSCCNIAPFEASVYKPIIANRPFKSLLTLAGKLFSLRGIDSPVTFAPMSRFTALFLAGIIGCQAFYNAGILTYWLANRAYITSTLCENRSRPAMHCDGKCYLKKKFAAATNPITGNGQQLPTLKKGLELAECPLRLALPLFISTAAASASNLPTGNCRCATGFPHTVFHPPSHQA